MCQQCYQSVAVYHAKIKPTILCRSVNPNIFSNASYIEAYRHINVKIYWVCTLLVRKTGQG